MLGANRAAGIRHSTMLPLGEEITIEVLPEQAGEFELTCQAARSTRPLARKTGAREPSRLSA